MSEPRPGIFTVIFQLFVKCSYIDQIQQECGADNDIHQLRFSFVQIK